MRIIVISDTHGNVNAIESVFLRNHDADLFIHLGDGDRDLDTFLSANPDYTDRTVNVCGNCDFNSLSPGFVVLPLFGHKIFATHGHLFAVKNSLEIIKKTAKENDCDIILYGHTHSRCNINEDGFHILNPGSASIPRDGNKPSFGHIDIFYSGVVINIADV